MKTYKDVPGKEWLHVEENGAKMSPPYEREVSLEPGGIVLAGNVRTFKSGATRDTDANKLDFEGFLSPVALEMFGHYMNKNRVQSDGSTRASDNWQKGIPKSAYMKSAFRHFFDMWKEHRGISTKDGMKAALCGLLFNVMGYMHVLDSDA